MESVLGFLEANDDSWSIDYERYNDFYQVAEKFGYKFETHKTAREVQNYLKKKIKETLHGEDINHEEFKRIQEHLALKYYASNESACVNSFKFVRLIRYVINSLNSYTKSLDSWCLVRDYLEAFLSISIDKPDTFLFSSDENKKIADSIIFLRKKGYQVSIHLGKIELEGNDEAKLLQAIDYRFKKIGYNSICFTLQCISPFYDSSLKRFFLRPEPSITETSKIDIPWGYIFNLSLSNLHFVKKSRNQKKCILNALSFQNTFFALRDYKHLINLVM